MDSIDWFGKNHTDTIFWQDSDPKHTCRRAKDRFKNHQINVMPWPACSPDLNPIEHLWKYILDRLNEYEQPPKLILELWERVEKEWEAIPEEVCQNLIESMPRRM